MLNPYQTQPAKIIKVQTEGADSVLMDLKPEKPFKFQPGQFIMISIPNYGEAPISICSNFNDPQGIFQIAVRKCGKLTSALHRKKKGQQLHYRGPYGHPFPYKLGKRRNLLLVAGGCGIEPIRPTILDAINNPKNYQQVMLFYGARNEDSLVFLKEFDKWEKALDLKLSLDEPQEKGFRSCQTGVITVLFDKYEVPEAPVVFLCGPESMYKFVVDKLHQLKVPDQDIYLSYERRMNCGFGICEHCALGRNYVCLDGPVFQYDQIKDEPF